MTTLLAPGAKLRAVPTTLRTALRSKHGGRSGTVTPMQPLGAFEFTKPLDDMTDEEIDVLAEVIAESAMEQLQAGDRALR